MNRFLLTTLLLCSLASAQAETLVIAHRGASGYLPEYTMEAKTLAHAMGADYIEQDVVMTADNALIVFHDLTLDRTTDVAERFPGRARDDGQHYVIDFSLAEIRQLQVTEGVVVNDGLAQAIYPQRFPPFRARFSIHTLAEEIELIQGLNSVTGRHAGIYPELKSPWFHHQHDKDLAVAALEVLAGYGYGNSDELIFLQSFDHAEIRRLHEELLPAYQLDIPLVQLIAENSWQETYVLNEDGSLKEYDYSWMHTPRGLGTLSGLVSGIGPSMDMIVTPDSVRGDLDITTLVTTAQQQGLVVHPYTFRREANRLPAYVTDFDELLELFINDLGVNGVFTDYPDLVRAFVDAQ